MMLPRSGGATGVICRTNCSGRARGEGIYDLAPLIEVSVNADLKLYAWGTDRVSPAGMHRQPMRL